LIYVVDASVAVGWFVREKGSPDATFLSEKTIKRIAPDLVFSEVTNVIQRKMRQGELTLKQAERALVILGNVFDEILPARVLYQAAFDLSRKLDHSVYDCMYLAATQSTDGSFLVTSDMKFIAKANAAGEGDRIHTLEMAHALFVTAQENKHG
jgi:predicted nucleic acid-binding protein